MKELKWRNWHEGIEMNELKLMNWHEWINMKHWKQKELKSMNWDKWIGMKELKLRNWTERTETNESQGIEMTVSCTFSRPHLPKVLRTKQSFTFFMWNRALATVSRTFSRPHLPKVLPTPHFFTILCDLYLMMMMW